MATSPHTLTEAKEQAAEWAAWIAVGASGAAVPLAMLGLRGFPPWWQVGLAFLMTLGLTLVARTRAQWARHVLVLGWAVLLPMLVQEPFITNRTALGVILPSALALLLAGPRSIVVATVVSHAIAVSRSPSWLASPYAQPEYLTIVVVLTITLLGVERVLTAAVARANQTVTLHQETEAQLAHEAEHDNATGLPNRRRFQETVGGLLGRVQAGDEEASVLIFDLDGFKVLNDSLGHDFGDRLILEVVERMRPALPDAASIFRFGGDELVVLCRGERGGRRGVELAETIVELVRQPFELDGRPVFVTASCGVAAVCAEHDRPEAVLRDADVAMYRAKERGRDRVEVFDDDMRGKAHRRHQLEQALRSALANEELSLVYQPRVSANDGHVVGFEALARWKNPELGNVGPVEFIPLAEETGLIVPIGRWVLGEACRKLKELQATSPKFGGLRMSVNVSGKQLLGREDFVDTVRTTLAETGVDAWSLELEITESVLMGNAERSIERIAALKALGVKIGIDDFGTGYSSLSHLRKLPVDVLKVDRAFVMGLGQSPEDGAIVHLVVMLAQALGLETVAEGVETEQQLEELRMLGCDEAQGYLLAKPMPLPDAIAYLQRAAGNLPSTRPTSRAAE